MKRSWSIFVVAITVVATAIAYEPLSLALFKIKEPYFKYPIRTSGSKMAIRGDDYGNGEFGSKRSGGRSHTGIDILANIGTPVYASKSGIAFCGNVPTGYGKYVMVYHPDGSQTMYAHLLESNIASPKRVRQGDVIGFVGKTGNASANSIQPHLHFEIRKRGQPQDPQNLVRK